MLPVKRTAEWLAGLLDGEGCFENTRSVPQRGGIYKYPRIQLQMTDEDTVRTAAAMMGNCPVGFREGQKAHHKRLWHTKIHGVRALGVMLSVFPYLSDRRRQKIECVLSEFEHSIGNVRSKSDK